MLNGLRNKVAIITGAGGGIGSAVARRLADEGCALVLVDVDRAAVAGVAAQLPNAIDVTADVSTPDGTAAYVRAALDAYGRVDLFHNNAGITGAVKPLRDLDVADFDRVQAVNVRGVFLGLQAVLRQLHEQGGGGAIVNTASSGALIGAPGLGPYVASKHAVAGLTRVAAHETRAQRVRVNAICPGIVDTMMSSDFAPEENPQQARRLEQILIGRVATTDEIANLVAWLLSDESSYVHGSILRIDGGLLT